VRHRNTGGGVSVAEQARSVNACRGGCTHLHSCKYLYLCGNFYMIMREYATTFAEKGYLISKYRVVYTHKGVCINMLI